ncbi:MAG: hypothetical protein L3J57_08680 [Desulfuromusa sp.]|nr:hypothetical protein [Desulfuromusa sp.]
MEQELLQKLMSLDELIQRERCYARDLKAKELKDLQEEKGLLLQELQALSVECSPELKQLASRIRDENIRNAQLLHTTLGYLREAMHCCFRQLTPVAYGQHGNPLQASPSGLLLTGKV